MAYTKEIINVGSTVDDGTGDLLRDAFTKVNTNFTNIWDKGGVNSNLNLTEFSITSDGDLILNPTSDLLIKKQTIINSDKGNFDLVVHGDTSDNVLYVDADTNRVGILTSTPTAALDVAGSLAVSVTTTTGNLSVTGNTILGNDVADLISINGRIGTDILPSGSRSIGSATNRYTKLSVTDIDATGTISGTFTGTIAPSTVITNTINTTSIASETLTATTSAEVGNLLVTGTLAVQGDSVTIDSATMQILDRLTFEGATADDFETSIVATDATADRTITLPDADGNIALFTTAPTGAIADGTAGQVLTTDGAGALSFTTVSGGAGAINGLSDVTITTATNGEVLKYNGSVWVNAASGIGLTDLSVSVAAAGSSTLTYDDSTGAFEFTPPDLSTYLTSVPAQTFASLTGTPTTLAGYGITDGYANTDVDAHLNQSGPTDGYVLSWTSGDYAWVAQTGGSSYADSDVDTHLNTGSATANQILSWDGSDYVWVADATGGAAGGNVTADGAGVLELSLDTSPVLGANLDANSFNIDMGTNVLTDTNLGQFITAYGWGDHSGAGYLTSYTVSESDVTTHEAALTITESQISDLGSYLTTVAFADLTGKPTTIAGYGITDAATQYANSDVDTHLNTSGATSGQVLSWDGSDYVWAADATGGASNSISQLNSYVSVTDTGTDGKITFATEGSDRWNMSSTGHLLPEDNETYDIGSATKKVRHLYLSDSSLKFVDSSDVEYAMRVDQGTGELKYGTKTISTALQDDVKMTPDSEYQHGIKVDFTPGSGDTVFSREVEVNGVRIVAAGAKLGATAVPDLWLDKVAQAYRLFIDKDAGSPIVEATQRNFIKRLRGDHGTPHAGLPTVQRVAYGGGATYSTNFLTDSGATSLGLDPFNNSHAMDDMVWYQNSSGTPGTGDLDAVEVIEHIMHTMHMKGLDSVALKMDPAVSSDWQTSDLYNAMAEAETASKWDPSGYAPNWKTDADTFPVAVKEYLYLLNFCMFEYSSLWDGGSLSPEWTDDMRTQSGIQTNNPLGYALHNTYIAPVISKPSLTTIRTMFTDGDTGNPADGGPSGYVPTPLPKPVIQTTVKPATSVGVAGDKLGLTAFDGSYIYYCTANYDGSTAIWKSTPLSNFETANGATSINTAGNTGTGSVTFASETLTVTGTTNQINVDAAGFALSFSLDADLTGLTTINTHTIPSGTGTLALTGDHPQHTFVIAASGSTDYTFSDGDNHWFPTTETDPVLYLRRGETYVFNVDALSGSHPFEIRVSNGGSAYSTGVTNNGATSGNITFKVPMSAPATLYYQCTAHAGMGNTINIV